MDLPSIAQSIAIPSGFLLGSYNFVFSQNVIPHLYTAPASISTPMFAKIFHIGSGTIAPVAASTILAYSYLSYQSTATKRTIYATSAVLTLSTLILTMTVMKPGINRLLEISTNSQLLGKAEIDQEVNRLLKSWVTSNYIRASLHLTAGALGFYALLA